MWILITKLNPQLCRHLCVVLSVVCKHTVLDLPVLVEELRLPSISVGCATAGSNNRFQCESSPVSWDSLHQCLRAFIQSYTNRGERTGFQEQECSKSSGQQEHQQAPWLPYEQTCFCFKTRDCFKTRGVVFKLRLADCKEVTHSLCGILLLEHRFAILLKQ